MALGRSLDYTKAMQGVILFQGALEREYMQRKWEEVEDLVTLGMRTVTLVFNSEGGAGWTCMEFTQKLINITKDNQVRLEARIYRARSAAAKIDRKSTR